MRGYLGYFLGLACYLPILYLNYTSDGGYLDEVEVFFTPLILGCFWLWGYSCVTLKVSDRLKAFLITFESVAVMLIVPEISYLYLDGEPYVRALQSAFSGVSVIALILFSAVYLSYLGFGQSNRGKKVW